VIATQSADGNHRVSFVDLDVTPGERYGYRLSSTTGADDLPGTLAWVDVPGRFAWWLRGARPNPAFGEAGLELTLPSAGRLELEMFDVHGRRVGDRRSVQLQAGNHTIPMRAEGRSPGVYLIRATFAGTTRECRIVFLE
jgi:hypothetical protein